MSMIYAHWCYFLGGFLALIAIKEENEEIVESVEWGYTWIWDSLKLFGNIAWVVPPHSVAV